MTSPDLTPELTPTQERALVELFGSRGCRLSFDPALSLRLRSTLEVALADVADGLGGQQLVVHKTALARVHTCERHELEEAATGFEWSAVTSTGAVAHKAIELWVGQRQPPPLPELVDVAIERLIEERPRNGLGDWLMTASPVERAELHVSALDHVLKFEDEFPPLKAAWRPRLESSLRAELCGDRIVLQGTVDLALGRAEGTRAGVLIVDFKTGRPWAGHAEDLRFYALLETLRSGVPPFRVASWYLSEGRWHAEDINEDVLESAVRRVVDGARKLYEIAVLARPPTLTPGPACTYCVVNRTCEAARLQGDDEL